MVRTFPPFAWAGAPTRNVLTNTAPNSAHVTASRLIGLTPRVAISRP